MDRHEKMIKDALQHSYDEMKLPDNWQSNIPSIDSISAQQRANTEEQNKSGKNSKKTSEKFAPETKEAATSVPKSTLGGEKQENASFFKRMRDRIMPRNKELEQWAYERALNDSPDELRQLYGMLDGVFGFEDAKTAMMKRADCPKDVVNKALHATDANLRAGALLRPETPENIRNFFAKYSLNPKVRKILKREMANVPEQKLNQAKPQQTDSAFDIGDRDAAQNFHYKMSPERDAERALRVRTDDLVKIRQSPEGLLQVSDQLPEYCKLAVRRWPNALQYVREQTPELCMAAVKAHGEALKYVKDQTPEICKEAVRNDVLALLDVKDLTSDICKEAVRHNAYALRILVQTEDICMETVKVHPYALQDIKNPSFAVCKEACKAFPNAFNFVPEHMKTSVQHSLKNAPPLKVPSHNRGFER